MVNSSLNEWEQLNHDNLVVEKTRKTVKEGVKGVGGNSAKSRPAKNNVIGASKKKRIMFL